MSAQTKSKESSSGKPQSRRHLSNKSFFEGEQSRKDPFSTNQVGSGSFFQPRLHIHSGYDFHEAEADRIAEQIVTAPTVTPAVQQKMAGDPKQGKGLAATITPLRMGHTPQRLPAFFSPSELDTNSAQEGGDIQAKSENAINGIGTLAGQPPPQLEKQDEDSNVLANETGQFQTESNHLPSAPDSGFESHLQANKDGGSPLTEPTRAEMEKGFGTDFSGVRLHTDSEAAGMNNQLQAHAFTHGSDIYFNEGQYQPHTSEGKHLIAHELTHTVQQGATSTLEPTEQEQQPAEGNVPNELISSAAPIAIPEADPKLDDKAEVEDALANESQEVDVQNVETGTDEATESANVRPRSPEEDPNFQAVTQNAHEVAEHQQRHNPPEAEAASAQAAAPVASNEVMGAAQASQVEAMNEQEPNEFDAVGFKTKLMERIASMQMPNTLEEADEFEKHSNINDINQAANQDVGVAQANAAGPIDAATQAEPNTEVVPEREVVDLPEADIGTTPDSIGANTAMPAPRPDSEVSQPLQENMGKVDDVMSENEVTDNMLANSNEPSFTGALAQTNEARAHTESAPQGLREEEGNTLGNAQRNSENQSDAQLQNMQTDREGIFGTLTNQQTQTATQDTSERTRISSEIDAIYNKAKTDVEAILEGLENDVSEKFTAASERAKDAFEKYVADEMRAYKRKRYDVIGGSLLWARDKIFGMPKEVEKFFVEGRQVFIDHMDKELTVISEYVAQQLNAAKDRIAEGRQEVADYVAELPENLQSIGKEAADAIQDQFDSLQDSVNEKQDALIESLAQQYSSALEEVDARIEEMKAENAGLIDAVMGAIMAIIETIINIKNMLLNLLAKAVQAIGTIISDPIGFLTNLFAGIKLGFEQFGTNILKHLQAGFLTWLTGAMSGVSLQMPDDIFSLKGIFSLTSQILGFTWDRVRAIGVKVIGEPIIKALEVGFDIVMILKNEGIAGLWEYIKDQFNDLKETVMNAIMDMLQSQVIQAGIKWILALLSPVGAFIKACMAIIDVVVFFVQKAKQIIELIDAFLDAILAVASGSVGAVASLIENALARAVPVLIGFLASLLGVSGLASKVTKIFQKIQQRVEKAVTKLWVKIKEMGKKVLAKLGIGAKEKPKNKQEHDAQVKAGLAYLHEQERLHDKDGNKALTYEEANKVSSKTKNKFAVFSSINPRDVGGKWVYDWKGSGGTEEGIKVEPSEHGDLKVGNHPLTGSGKESHHVPAKQLAYSLRNFYTSVDDILPESNAYKNLKESIKKRETTINANHGGDGNNLSAILIDKATHRTGSKAVHQTEIQTTVYNEIKNLAGAIENAKKNVVVVVPATKEKRTIANLTSAHWQAFIKQMYMFEKANSEVLDINTTKDGALFVISAGNPSGNAEISIEISKAIKSTESSDEATKENSKRIANIINKTANKTFDNSLNIGIEALKQALKASNKDGEPSTHPAALSKLKNVAKTVWNAIILKDFS